MTDNAQSLLPEESESALKGRPEGSPEAINSARYDDNPFRLPSDEEVFVTREAEKRRLQEQKEKEKQLNIWEKGTAISKSSFRRPKDSDIPLIEMKEEADEDKSKRRKALIQAALDIVSARVRGASGKSLYEKKQSMREFVDQKKDMFLVVKTTRILNNERTNLEKMADERENALSLAEKQMKKNKEEFINKKKQQADETKESLQKLEAKIKEKQQKEEELVRLEQDETNMRQRNKNNIEREENLWFYKQFHDKVANKEWLAQQRLEAMKKNWIQKKVLEELPERERLRRNVVVSEEKQAKLGEEFNKLVRDNEIPIDNPDQAFQLYFEKPEQLMEIFTLLEEQNLMLIEKNQGLLKEIEEKKASFNTTKTRIEKRHTNLFENEQKLLEKNKEEEKRINEQIAIQESKEDQDIAKYFNEFKAMISQVYSEAIKLQQKFRYNSDVSTEKLIEYLTEIEAKIDTIRKKVGDKPSLALLKAQNDQKQRIMEAKTTKKNQEKIEKNNQAKRDSERRDKERELKKHVGKPIMKKTCIAKKLKKETKKVETNDEEQEFIKYFEI